MSAGPGGMGQAQGDQAMEQHISGAMEEQAKLISLESGTGGSIGMEPILMVFDEAFHPAPGTKDALIDEGRLATFKVGYHIARVRTA